MRLQRPSPSLVISCIALFVALGGVGYAAATGSIDGREIKNNAVATKDLRNNDVRGRDIRRSTIAGSDIAPNTLTGSDISETSLGKVPSAGQADNAATAGSATTANSAGNANTVGGLSLRTISFRPAGDIANGPIGSLAGLTVFASCNGSTLTLTATTALDASSIYTQAVDTDTDNRVFSDDLESGTFDRNVPFSLLAGEDGNPDIVSFVYERADGRTVTGQLATDVTAFTPACSVVGTLIGA